MSTSSTPRELPPTNLEPSTLAQNDLSEIPARRVLGLSVLALVSGIGVACWLDRSSSEVFTGIVEAEQVTVTSTSDARIREILVETGALVKPGDPLFVLEDRSVAQQIVDAQQELALLTEELEQSRARADVELAWRTRSLDEEELQTQLQAANCLKQQFFSEFEHVAWGDFANSQAVTSADSSSSGLFHFATYPDRTASDLARLKAVFQQQSAENSAEVSEAQLKLCETRLEEIQTLKTDLPDKIRRAEGVDRAEAQLAQATERLRLLKQQPELATVTASNYGTVGVFENRVGDVVSAGATILQLLDEDRRFVTVRIPTGLVPRVQAAGQAILLFPGDEERYGSLCPVPPQTEAYPGQANAPLSEEPYVTLRINPSGALWPAIPIGSAVQVTFAESVQ